MLLIAGTLAGCGGGKDALTSDEAKGKDGTAPVTEQGNKGASSEADGTEPPEETEEEAEEVTEAEPEETAAEVRYTVRPAEWASVEWEYYSDVFFTLKKPKGWKVQWQGDVNQMQWIVTSPDGTIGLSNLDHDYAAKDPNMAQTLGFRLSLTSGTVREYFENVYKDSTNYFSVENSCVPANRDFVQSLRPYTPINDYQALYATFSEPGLESGEGIYSAVIMNNQDIYIRGMNYANWEINAIFTEWAPLGALVNWIPVFSEILNSFSYTDYYIQLWMANTPSATSAPSLSDSDPILEAFEERSRSDTIIQEKRSDMLEEYDRVYDTETGDIYRAYEGFLDDMGDQDRYVPVTDDQYTEGYVGWIDKD